ncbi:SDR family NAD(P)-dependent oxidoreductase [Parendozoicomonas haliclonae]|uniref:3-oxoacyl-[acyl-carrier-protein] reductase FabG n=1 Tax=Parendozoicomonas haliclonae TaxID=1960125 RepID=A0A1X7APY8_9GAMM|nr:SDR family NAD(P)-dependent oxidoreductase [Parendozoicomonas haliclonae]SMA50182.1 3-oxoacyl-[acyl-carrier-protein] reductase FabG [Parendozoicomonas haliclonae]
MNLELQGKRVLVTGSTGGIGKAIASHYLAEGAVVIINGRDQARCEAIAKELSTEHSAADRVLAMAGDLSDAAQTSALLDQLEAQGGVDILINNTGIFEVKAFENIEDDEWMHYFNVNVMSAVRLSRALLPKMLGRGFGRIVNISSECGVKPLGQMVHYSVTKTALMSLSRALSELTKGKDVTVNSVLPGPTWTEGVENYFDTLSAKEGKPVEELTTNYFADHEPTSLLQRFVDVNEVAKATVFLTSNRAMNGQSLRVEGGIIRAL